MIMTAEEYNNLKRFTKDDHTIKHNNYFYIGDVLEVYTIYETLAYVIITDSYHNLFFDLKKCSQNGEILHGKESSDMNGLSSSQIKQMIDKNDWRLFRRVPQKTKS